MSGADRLALHQLGIVARAFALTCGLGVALVALRALRKAACG
jgi:hypothetical protein